MAELHFLIPVIDQKRSSANRQNDPQKEVNYNKPLDSFLLSMSPLSEKIVAFVIDDDEGREVFYADFADSFHTEFFEIDHFDRFYAVLSQNGCRSTDRSQIESAMLFAGISDVDRTVEKDIEVLLLSGPIDRWIMQFLTEFQGKKLVNIAKGDLDLGDLADKEEKEEKEKVQAEYKPLVDEFKAALGDSVEDVRMTLRLTDSPSCIVTDPNGLDPAFVRMMKAAGQDVPEPKPILELNPNNPLVSRLKEQAAFSPEWAKLFLEQAQLMEGEQLKDPAGFINRMNTMLMDTIGKKSVN